MEESPELARYNAAPQETVTVLMTAYNSEETIEESVRSIMAQTFQDWKLVIVHDITPDKTGEIIDRLSLEDPRIICIHNSERLGMVGAFNFGLRLCRGKYVARLDADDLCHPQRLEKQVEFLESNPDVKLLGTWVDRISATGQFIDRLQQGPSTLEAYTAIRKQRIPFWFIHSSLMIENAVYQQFKYRDDDDTAEDSWMCNRIALHYPTLSLPEYLTTYRVSEGGAHSKRFRRSCFQTVRLEYCLENETELDSEAFAKLVESSLRLKWRIWKTYAQKYTIRRAGLAYYDRRHISAAFFLALSAIVNPLFTFQRVSSRAKRLMQRA